MRKRLAGLVMCLTAAAVMLPASPAAAATCVIDDVAKDLVPCVRYQTCWLTGICV